MKKIIKAFIISVAINAAGMCINYLLYVRYGGLLFARRMQGGECMEECGFGLSVLHLYPMGLAGESSPSAHLSLDLPGLLRSVLLIAVIAYVLILIISRIRKSKERI